MSRKTVTAPVIKDHIAVNLKTADKFVGGLRLPGDEPTDGIGEARQRCFCGEREGSVQILRHDGGKTIPDHFRQEAVFLVFAVRRQGCGEVPDLRGVQHRQRGSERKADGG